MESPTTPRADQQRVNIDALSDWLRIKNEYIASLTRKADEAILARNIPVEERDGIMAELLRTAQQTFSMAEKNLRVNGRNFENLEAHEQQGMEPFDEALDRHVWSLADTRFNWHKTLAQERRNTPMEVAKSMEEMLKLRRQLDEEQAKADKEDPGNDEAMADDEYDFGPRYEATVDRFRDIEAIAHELEQSVPQQYERAERYESVANDVRSLKP